MGTKKFIAEETLRLYRQRVTLKLWATEEKDEYTNLLAACGQNLAFPSMIV